MEVLTTEEIIYLSVTGAIALLAVIAGLTINALKKDWMKYYYYVMAAIVAVYAITVISLNFDAFEQGYQVWLTLGVFAAIAVIIAVVSTVTVVIVPAIRIGVSVVCCTAVVLSLAECVLKGILSAYDQIGCDSTLPCMDIPDDAV